MRVKLSRRGRWAVPATALAVIGGVIAGVSIPAAQASPALPARTPIWVASRPSADVAARLCSGSAAAWIAYWKG